MQKLSPKLLVTNRSLSPPLPLPHQPDGIEPRSSFEQLHSGQKSRGASVEAAHRMLGAWPPAGHQQEEPQPPTEAHLNPILRQGCSPGPRASVPLGPVSFDLLFG
jgi:hypothetical protein